MSHSTSNTAQLKSQFDRSIEISIAQLNWPPEEHAPQTGQNEKRAVKNFDTTQKYAIFLLRRPRTNISDPSSPWVSPSELSGSVHSPPMLSSCAGRVPASCISDENSIASQSFRQPSEHLSSLSST